ncbi:hypothetical protein [Gorillibacterium sp. sgz5001074]|uniref:hypothetical protein n=1 Tax=Gorillibacterium sp. sgz5001074 TaxID=3446695 RepID=UPI003F6666B2
MKLIFRDNFFCAGKTEIVDENSHPMGSLDLKSAFGSSLDVYDREGRLVGGGRFRSFSGKWEVTGANREVLGVLRARFSFVDKKYEYDAGARGIFSIRSPAFSREYTVTDHMERKAAHFGRVSGWFSAGAYALENSTDKLSDAELIAVVMGVHSIQKRQSSAQA